MSVVTVILNGLGLVLAYWQLVLGLALLVVFFTWVSSHTTLFAFIGMCITGLVVVIQSQPKTPEQYLAILAMLVVVLVLFVWAGKTFKFKRE